jgi:hypothetical protein
MRITINTTVGTRIEEPPSFFASLITRRRNINEYIVSLKIELSEEERAIIAAHQLWDVQILTQPLYIAPDALTKYPELHSHVGAPVSFKIKDLVGAGTADGMFHQMFYTPVDAANFEAELKNDTLPKLKRYIEASREIGGSSSQTFEL